MLVKDDMPLFLQQKGLAYQKAPTGYPDSKSDLFLYDPFVKNPPAKNLQESMLNLCQQYNSSLHLLPYLGYYHPGTLIGGGVQHHEENSNIDHRD